MAQKLVVGPFEKGLKTDVTPFLVNNDSFPKLINAYQWRKRIRRKRGTKYVGRLQRYHVPSVTLDGSGNGNLLTGLEASANLVPGSVSFTATVAFTDNGNGTLSPTGTINYVTGAISLGITYAGATLVNPKITYYPCLPVMGIEPYAYPNLEAPFTLLFDTVYSYNLSGGQPYDIHDVSFYKNPQGTPYTNYIAKTTWSNVNWSGADYQQFWSASFCNALWVTNGKPGMQFEPKGSVTVTAGTATTITFTGITAVIGDFLFFNEWTGTNSAQMNGQTGYVTSLVGGVVVTFPNCNFTWAGSPPWPSGGMVQYLTRSKSNSLDGIRWYDGDPTSGTPPVPATGLGWVNFAPPLSQGIFSIETAPAGLYYLVGAKMIYPFRDFLLFFGPYIQQSGSSSQPIYLKDTVIFSQNGSPFYTASFDANTAGSAYNSILTPGVTGTTADLFGASPRAFWEDVTGYGGYIAAGVAQPITSLVPNEDVLILGFPNAFTRLIYTGNNLIPFLFYRINTEYGTSSRFSAITFDQGSFTLGQYGVVMTSQVSAKRVDEDILDQMLYVKYTDNGADRISSGRNFETEWVYITYASPSNLSKFPTQSLMYNYRENTWAIVNETYTTYGQYTEVTANGDTWGQANYSWESASFPWVFGTVSIGTPQLLAGNAQGFVLLRDTGTYESPSGYIQSIGASTITSPNHGLFANDPFSGAANYVYVTGATGTIASQINGKVFRASPVDENVITLEGENFTGTYTGGGVFTRLYVPFIQSKQFPLAWSDSRKTRLGSQAYLITRTANGQAVINLYLSQDAYDVWNDPNSNPAILYSQIIFTCPESTNLGLTPQNTNLQELNLIDQTGASFNPQAQIWKRFNTSLIGDTVQFAITLNDSQMLDQTLTNQTSELELHGVIMDVSPSQVLC